MIAQRVLAVIAATFLIATVAIATFGVQSLSLGDALFLVDHNLADKLAAWCRRAMGDWAWLSLLQPLLARPAWLVPASAGLICVGLSLSLQNRKTRHRSHRRS